MTDPRGSSQYEQEPGDRRDPSGPRRGDRRRGGWRDFRRNYPGFVFTLLVAVIAMIAIDVTLIMKRRAYAEEVARLQANMTQQERAKTQAIVAAEENKTRIAIELARRQAKLEKTLHLSVAVDSGRIYLEREGAVLREIAAAFGAETKMGPDSIPVVIPRGETSIAKIDANTFVLEGGTVVGATTAPSLAQDSTHIPAGSVRITSTDMKAILPNLRVGMRVFFY